MDYFLKKKIKVLPSLGCRVFTSGPCNHLLFQSMSFFFLILREKSPQVHCDKPRTFKTVQYRRQHSYSEKALVMTQTREHTNKFISIGQSTATSEEDQCPTKYALCCWIVSGYLPLVYQSLYASVRGIETHKFLCDT